MKMSQITQMGSANHIDGAPITQAEPTITQTGG
ncbi:hypothetical protein BAAM0483_08275 [Bifidobacterium animalis subsp. animalis MCC 0483]|uniref:Uncharacterized protein n=1 Tax=Bifidobacterium animalis subsp. animalis MCC 0483 TaxID=1365955 RepID=A0AB34T822_9BIFI|nr:hypothetical protein BAAM0483_08275 [Bifidobacterium animalis subsp. animalis MCC 0483]KOA61132.1 hypothetical protein BAAM0499_05320 [Bifidobacterium animalis subsp. animalis MCC 0499]